MGELVHPEVEIHTARTTHRGAEAAQEWSQRTYDHLVRRFVPERIEPSTEGAHVIGRVEYVWRETGEVGDSAPVEIELGIRDGLISSWRLDD